MDKAYLCDGHACAVPSIHCYINGGECRHTKDATHSLSANDPNFSPTKFIIFGDGWFEYEEIDEDKKRD